jgi:pyruvate,water dikinase
VPEEHVVSQEHLEARPHFALMGVNGLSLGGSVPVAPGRELPPGRGGAAPDAVFARGAGEAEAAVRELAGRVGALRGRVVAAALRTTREFAGLRELPKYWLVTVLGTARTELLAVGADLVSGGWIDRVRRRVVLDPADAHLDPGDVLVCPSTDPGWTPLFLTAGALVMEMGGANSHGAVVAREYGLPAVVGVRDAVARLQDAATARVDGTAGTVEAM